MQVTLSPHDAEEDSRLQMNKIRAQLVGAFREQKEMRRSLVELENTTVELHMDMSRHLLTIADWEREKTHLRAHSSQGEPEKEEPPADADGDDGESTEPHEVALAREEVNLLLAEQRKTAALKVAIAAGAGVASADWGQREPWWNQRVLGSKANRNRVVGDETGAPGGGWSQIPGRLGTDLGLTTRPRAVG